MNILVTGAGGFLGWALANTFRKDHIVHALIHDQRLHYWAMNVRALVGDIKDYDRMQEIVIDAEIDQIYHCAAKSIVRNCRCDPLGCFQTNVIGTANLLEAARQSDRISGIMVMESDKAYGPGRLPYREDQVLDPAGIYEASKACAGHVARAYYRNYGVPVFTIRSANVYGPGDRHESRLVPGTIRRILRAERPRITSGAGNFVREFIFLDDWIAYTLALMKKRPWGETFNVGTGETHTIAEVVGMISELMESPLEVEEWPKPDTLLEIPQQFLAIDKLRQWVPNVHPRSMRTGLEETIEWYRNRN